MDDVLERAERLINKFRNQWGYHPLDGEKMVCDLAAEVRALRKDRERAKSEIEKAVELIQRWGCECEPQIGFTCGPCRVVEMIDAALAAAKGE